MKKLATCAVFFMLVQGCAAAPKSGSVAPVGAAAPATTAMPASAPPPAPEPDAAPATSSTADARPSSSPAPATTTPSSGKKSDASKDAPGTSRSQVDGEMERAQRALDVAGGSCANACRALGSMDRAAGRICGLARSSDERELCTDAATKVKTARDKVKRTCGSCPDVTVERDASIPSR